MGKRNLFTAGDCQDIAYKCVRDLPHYAEGRLFAESLWVRYQGYEDRHFLDEVKSHFVARFWEMYLAVTLLDRGFQLIRPENAGPEFYFVDEGRKVWVEAVAPDAGTGNDGVPNIEPGKVFSVPTERILLRFTNALVEKRRRYVEAVDKKIIHQDDLYVIAINSCAIPHAALGNTLPFFVQAFLPIGNLTLVLDKTTRKITESFYQRRDTVTKVNGAAVSTSSFLDSRFGFVSGVLHSAVNCINKPPALGGDFSILHNPIAAHQLGDSLFAWCEQMHYIDDVLEITEADGKAGI